MDTPRQVIGRRIEDGPVKLTWVDKAKKVDAYHALRIQQSHEKGLGWTIDDTAKSLNRSYGSVAEDVMLVDWFRSHPKLEDMRSRRTAIEFVRERRKKMRLREA